MRNPHCQILTVLKHVLDIDESCSISSLFKGWAGILGPVDHMYSLIMHFQFSTQFNSVDTNTMQTSHWSSNASSTSLSAILVFSRQIQLFSSSLNTTITKKSCIFLLKNWKIYYPSRKNTGSNLSCGLHQNTETLNKLMVFCTDLSHWNKLYAEKIFNYIECPSFRAFAKKGGFCFFL